jgi:aminoglycoside 6'-N-acetyltransferase I
MVNVVAVRPLGSDERPECLTLRERLWPESGREALAAEQQEILTHSAQNAVLVAAAEGELVGFVEASLRDWAEGCESRPVGYIEGWYVEPSYRRRGIGRRLVEAAEAWARSRGCTEMGSDALLTNTVSHRAHAAIGYHEVERLVLFSKKL